MVGGEGDDQLWGSGRGVIAGCHCTLLWYGRVPWVSTSVERRPATFGHIAAKL